MGVIAADKTVAGIGEVGQVKRTETAGPERKGPAMGPNGQDEAGRSRDRRR
jgi:hypothetical protein